jgi:hypothetical protein
MRAVAQGMVFISSDNFNTPPQDAKEVDSPA